MPRSPDAKAVAREWVVAVMDRGDLQAGWELTDPPLRLVLAQHWVLARHQDPEVAAEDRDALAAALATSPPEHHLWERFASHRIRRWRQHWGNFGTGGWDVDDQTEPLSPGLEVVTFLERHRLMGWARPGPPPATRRFAMRQTAEGWLVAGLDGSALFRPGWPPTQVPVSAL